MKLAIMQPYFFPYIGYFQLINAVDTFVFYDDVNFIKRGWIHRNNLLINNKARLFTIPCKAASQNKLINEIEHDFNEKEKFLFLKKIEYAYKRATHFDFFFPLLKNFINDDESENISILAANSVQFICDYLGIKKSFKFSSKNHHNSLGIEKQSRLIEIAKNEDATIYINSIGGKALYNKKVFDIAGVQLKFLETKSINYSQNDSSFVPWLSIIDIIMYNNIEQVNKMLLEYSLD